MERFGEGFGTEEFEEGIGTEFENGAEFGFDNPDAEGQGDGADGEEDGFSQFFDDPDAQEGGAEEFEDGEGADGEGIEGEGVGEDIVRVGAEWPGAEWPSEGEAPESQEGPVQHMDRDWDYQGEQEADGAEAPVVPEMGLDDFGVSGTETGDTEGEVEDNPTSEFFDEGEEAGDFGAQVEGFGEDGDDFNMALQGSQFISEGGELIVQDTDDSAEDHFEVIYIEIDKITAVSRRIRKPSMAGIEALTSSIRSTGLLNPPVVAPLAVEGTYVLIDGLRRLIACGRAGIKRVPCIVNNKIKTNEIPIVEAMYNHGTPYSVKEKLDYIEYLENERGIHNPNMIEYLLQMDNGDYSKLKDIINDNDEDIVSKLMNGQMTIQAAFKALEKRRQKESREEKELKKVQGVYMDTSESGADQMEGSGETGNNEDALTEEELKALSITASELDEDSGESLGQMVAEGDSVEGYKPRKQDVHDRKPLDPALRKAVIMRDKCTCRVCGLHVDSMEPFDCHHISPVATGGLDSIDNMITLCTTDHRLIHMWAMGTLFLKPEEEMEEAERERFKKIVRLGNVIRKQMAARGIKREEMKKLDHSDTIGRTYPGSNVQYAD